MAAADACAARHGFLPELSPSPCSTPSEVSPCHQRTVLPRSNDVLVRHLSGQTPVRRDAQEEKNKPLELADTNLVTVRKEDQALGNLNAQRTPKDRPKRGGCMLTKSRMMQRGILAACWDLKGRAAGVHDMPNLRGDTCGDAAEVAGLGGDRKEVEADIGTSCVGMGQEKDQCDPTPGTSQLWNSLIDENNALRRQVGEMETFLKDHGLVWVGSGPRPGEKKRGDCPTSTELDRIMCNIQELNDEVEREGRRRVVQTRGGAEFQATRFLRLAFHADGIVVDNGDVRRYSECATKSFIADLRDGFFPAEFRASNPDGLLIHAVDHRAVDSTARPTDRHGAQLYTPFSGMGRRVAGGAPENPSGQEHSTTRKVAGDIPVAPPTISRGLRVSAPLKGISSPEASLVNPREQQLGGHANPTDGYSAEKCCTKPRAVLRIRVAPTELTMEFRLDYKETVEDLWHLITRRIREKLTEEENQPSSLATHFRGIGACSGRPANETDRLAAAFELRLPYPSHERIDLRRTIEEAGLTPNAVVIFQRREGDTPLGSSRSQK